MKRVTKNNNGPAQKQLVLVVAYSLYIHHRGKDFDILDKISAKSRMRKKILPKV